MPKPKSKTIVPSKRTPIPASNSNALTVPQRMAAVMGDQAMSAGQLVEALEAAGEVFESTNLRTYMSTMLNSTMMGVTDTAGKPILGGNDKPLKVHTFTVVERGIYRVSTKEDIQREVNELLASQGKRAKLTVAKSSPAQGAPSKAQPKANGAKPSTAPSPEEPSTRETPVLGGIPDLRALVRSVVVDELRAVVKEELHSILSAIK